jgi:hypothetical protein
MTLWKEGQQPIEMGKLAAIPPAQDHFFALQRAYRWWFPFAFPAVRFSVGHLAILLYPEKSGFLPCGFGRSYQIC